MRVLWVVNIMLPAYALKKGIASSVREGWLTGIYEQIVSAGSKGEDLTLGVLFPAPKKGRAEVVDGVTFYPFKEDLAHPERYDKSLEKKFFDIIEQFQPDIAHIFGTEFPHALAFVRAFQSPERTLIGLQGICTEIAKYYRADLPDTVFSHATIRDAVKRDSLEQQRDKMEIRGVRERGAMLLAGHITGRTSFDREFAKKLCPRAIYHPLNETMRPAFYEGAWSLERADRHTIFVAQGDYPLKGLHFLLRAMPQLIRRFPDLRLKIAGIPVFDHRKEGGRKEGSGKRRAFLAVKKRLPQDVRNGAYGEYLRQIITAGSFWDHVTLTGVLDAEQMREAYLSAHIVLCPSMLENSPNSVAEAMLLGVPCAASRAGGIPSMIEDHQTGLLFTAGDSKSLALAVNELFEDDTLCRTLSENAREVARIRHDPETNGNRLLAIYREMLA
ncbi:MAG: glycosyltransferase family 4 protein [Lachnospiraceae bacterium]|nr:glycosyltransferase family 4 protein [Lachnospiraceae bacterium]